MEFQNAVIANEEWRILPSGAFHLYPGRLEARRGGGSCLTKCLVGPLRFVVFVDELDPALETRMRASRPDWVDALLVVRAGTIEGGTAELDVDSETYREIAPEVCAFVAGLAAEANGAFRLVPERYLVQLSGVGAFDVAIELDWDTETWGGDAHWLAQSGTPLVR